jgi:U3 small nucleolar RNA-associated protein 4
MAKMSNPKMHNVRFYKPAPNAVYCMALQPQESKLAISRSDARIEIWNLTHCPFIERTIASSAENFSIEGLIWCDTRLFSVGLHGLLIEYDLYKLEVRNKLVVTGGAAFCLDINAEKNRIAVGTEQGYLNIFKIAEDEMLFEKFLDKQEGRILCLKFDQSGEFIVSGGLDAIRIWSVSTNQALHKMVTGRSDSNKPTIVWCLAVTEDFTIISGDSRGILTVWDGKLGTQLESYQSHRADILSVCLSEDKTSVYCAGVDPNIINYVRVKVKDDTQKWVRSIQRKIHEHDVRAMVIDGHKLYSSGVDGYLACSYHPPKTLLKFPPILQNPCVKVCSKARYVMLRYPDFIEVWSLGTANNAKDEQTGLFMLDTNPKKLVVIRKTVKNAAGERSEGIICATMSDDGTLILYSTRLGVRLLKLECDDDSPKLIPIEMMDGLGEVPCTSAIFTSNKRLILAPNTGGLQVVGFDNDSPVLIQNVDASSEFRDAITLLTVSSCSQYVVGGNAKGDIVVWTLKNYQYIYYCKLPKYQLCPTAMAIHPKLPNLVVTYSDNKIIEFSLKEAQLTKFSRSLSKNLPKQLTTKYSTIRSVTFDPRVDHVIILHDDDSIIVIDKDKVTCTKDVKVPRFENNIDGRQSQQIAVRTIRKYKHLVHLSWLSDDEMVAVEVNPLGLIEQLPPCLVQNSFGRK